MDAASPAGYHTVTPRIVASDPTQVVDFLETVFGATARSVAGGPTEVSIGDSLVLVSGTLERDPFPAFLYVYVDDADAVHARAVDAGATTLETPRDTPYGDRRAMIVDGFGNVYQIAHRGAAR
jgi:PhnB protein